MVAAAAAAAIPAITGAATATAGAIGSGIAAIGGPAAAASLGAAGINAIGGIIGSGNAADAISQGAANASQVEQNMYNTTRNDLLPYNTAGQQASSTLSGLMPSLIAPIHMDEATLEQTPGYQFNLTQGLKAVQNSAAARGLGSSGAALKGAASYATGLADSTYQNQFNNAMANNNSAYNKLIGQIQVGANAGAQTGQFGTTVAGQQGANAIASGNAQGSSDVAAANAVGSAATSASNLYLTNNLLKSNGGKGLFG